MTEPTPAAVPPPPRRRPGPAKILLGVGLIATGGALVWNLYGHKIWDEYQVMRTEVRASEDSSPVGYVGLNYRRSYND